MNLDPIPRLECVDRVGRSLTTAARIWQRRGSAIYGSLGAAALLALTMLGCSTESPNARRQAWETLLLDDFDARRWRETSDEDLYKPKNARRSMVHELLRRPWKGMKLVDVMYELGNPDFQVSGENRSEPKSENVRLAICYRFSMAQDGAVEFVYLNIDKFGIVRKVGTRTNLE